MRDSPTRSGVKPPHAQDEAQCAEDTPERTPDGRFASGHSGNPKGRPPKPKEDIASILRRILEEELPREDGGPPKSVCETLLRQTFAHGMSQPRIALALLKLCLSGSSRQFEPKIEADEDDRRKTILSDYVDRQARLRDARAANTKADDPGEVDEETE